MVFSLQKFFQKTHSYTCSFLTHDAPYNRKYHPRMVMHQQIALTSKLFIVKRTKKKRINFIINKKTRIFAY